jgi:hypothetical protein
VGVRAEALRNACIQAAFFGGGDGASPGERFATIDLTRPGTSAMASGLEPMEMPDERADRAAALWRKLATVTSRLARSRAPHADGDRAASGTGLEAALSRLRRIGVIPGDDSGAGGWSRGDIRLELMEAAVECGTDTDPATGRYLVLDRMAGTTDEEFDQLNALGFGASSEQLQTAIAQRESELAHVGAQPEA